MFGKPRVNPESPRSLWRILHEDQRGGVSLETVLLLAAVALPILIFVIRFGWPRIREIFLKGIAEMEEAGEEAQRGH